jgi:hypothetical protein
VRWRSEQGRSTAIPWSLVLLLSLSLGLRLAVVGLDGHANDARTLSGWAESLASQGLGQFYATQTSPYPALLYVFWPLGMLLDDQALALAIKASSIPFDLALGALLYAVVRGYAGGTAGLAAAAVYLLNPGVIIDGPIWGQIDAAGTLAFLGALVALARPRYALAAALGMLAALVKPQFGLVMLPIAWVVAQDWVASRRLEPAVRAAAGATVVYAAISLPLNLTPVRYVEQLVFYAERLPYASLFAPNPWGLLFGYRTSDAGLAGIGASLLLIGLAAAILPLRRGVDRATLLTVGLLMVFAFYFLPTRVHERYLFPALALAAPFAAVSSWTLLAYASLSVAFAATLVYQLATTMPAAVPDPIRGVILAEPSVWIQGAVLGLSAVALAWLILRSLARERAQLRAGALSEG